MADDDEDGDDEEEDAGAGAATAEARTPITFALSVAPFVFLRALPEDPRAPRSRRHQQVDGGDAPKTRCAERRGIDGQGDP